MIGWDLRQKGTRRGKYLLLKWWKWRREKGREGVIAVGGLRGYSCLGILGGFCFPLLGDFSISRLHNVILLLSGFLRILMAIEGVNWGFRFSRDGAENEGRKKKYDFDFSK